MATKRTAETAFGEAQQPAKQEDKKRRKRTNRKRHNRASRDSTAPTAHSPVPMAQSQQMPPTQASGSAKVSDFLNPSTGPSKKRKNNRLVSKEKKKRRKLNALPESTSEVAAKSEKPVDKKDAANHSTSRKKGRRPNEGRTTNETREQPSKADTSRDTPETSHGPKSGETRLEDRITFPEDKLVQSRSRSGKKRKLRLESPAAGTGQEQQPSWMRKTEIAGHFLGQDPILTPDAQHVILPTKSSVQIYSARTSLLIRSLATRDSDKVTSCAVSLANNDQVYVSSTSRGTVALWDWTTGHRVARWTLGAGLQRILGVMSDEKGNKERLLLLRREKNGYESVEVCKLEITPKPKHETALLLAKQQIAPFACIGPNGRSIILCSETNLLLGNRSDGSTEDQSPYKWRELPFNGTITSLDARFLPRKNQSVVNVALGFTNGVIQICENIFQQATIREKGIEQSDISSRRLHWHRGSVNTVKWSRDGNYLISGGNETVLVIWQLATNQQQVLPHLTTPILNLSVSIAGSAYCLRLADNSVMVLATADLLPSTNIAGLIIDGKRTFPSIMHPKNGNQVLLAGTSEACGMRASGILSSANALQTYDITSKLQLGRQALTRNMLTAVNISPKGHTIAEPNVTLMQITLDGQWLVTVDEWTPPSSDLDFLQPKSIRSGYARHKEIRLRFWHVNADSQSWEMVTRVDDPHDSYDICEMAVNPKRLEVATASSNGILHFWTPKSRVRSGLPVKDQSGSQLYTWKCSRLLDVEPLSASADLFRVSAALCYSEDGSVLAASWSTTSSPLRITHLISTLNLTTTHSQPNLLSPGVAKLAFIRQNLICLSPTSLQVFDTVTLETRLSVALDPLSVSGPESRLLAANPRDGTFALALSTPNTSGELGIWPHDSLLLVFNAHDLESGPVYQAQVPTRITNLMARTQGTGYVLIDSDARLVSLLPPAGGGAWSKTAPASASESAGHGTAEPDVVTRGLDKIFGPVGKARLDRAGDGEALDAKRVHDDVLAAETGRGAETGLQPGAGARAGGGSGVPPPGGNGGPGRTIESVFASTAGQPVSIRGLFERVVGFFAFKERDLN